jgi:hypothetical protein
MVVRGWRDRGGTIEVAEGELTLGILVAGPDGASLEATLAVAEAVASARAAALGS